MTEEKRKAGRPRMPDKENKWCVIIILDKEKRKLIEKYCANRGIVLGRLFGSLAKAWLNQNLKINKKFIENLEDDPYSYVNLVDRELEMRIKKKKITEL